MNEHPATLLRCVVERITYQNPENGYSVLKTHFVMLQRHLIYTGITRAKKICVLIGATKALAYAVHNMSVLKRNTSLRERLNPSLTTDGKLRG